MHNLNEYRNAKECTFEIPDGFPQGKRFRGIELMQVVIIEEDKNERQ